MIKLLILCALIGLVQRNVNAAGMVQVFHWKQMDFYNRGDKARPNPGMGSHGTDFVFPDQMRIRGLRKNYSKRDVIAKTTYVEKTSRDEPITAENRWAAGDTNAPNTSSYIAYNNVPMGATHFRGRLFVTLPRRRVGIPSTLNYIDMEKDSQIQSPKLRAYPNFEINQLMSNFTANPEHIVSVYRTSVDACNRLWFVDTGMLEYPDNRMQVQRPSIWVIDLMTDTFVRRFEIPESIVATGRGLASITVDVEPKSCGQAYAYVPDLLYRHLYVYSFRENRIWSFDHNYFNFDPLGGDLNIGGQTFRWDDGIFSVTLGAKNPQNGFRNVYFHAMASTNEFYVSNVVLKNESNSMRSDHGDDFKLLGSRGHRRQSTMHEYDSRTGVLFYNEIQQNGIGCWNTHKPFSEANHGVVMQDERRMIYPSDLTIDERGTIWVISNSLPVYIYSSLDPTVYNFRVWKQDVNTAVMNTICS